MSREEAKTSNRVCCSNCDAPLSNLKWCRSCKKVAYCNAKCQKSHWKAHRPKCTFDYLKYNDKANKSKPKFNAILIPFLAIHSSIFSKQKFISFLSHINNEIFYESVSTIIYQILTGYKETINLSSSLPSELLAVLQLHDRDKIETFGSPINLIPVDLQNHLWTLPSPDVLYEKLKCEADKGCNECKKSLNQYEQFMVEWFTKADQMSVDPRKMFVDFLGNVCKMKLPSHIGYNWSAFSVYEINFIRDNYDDSLSIAITSDQKFQGGHVLAVFRCTEIMPFFEGAHYAYLLKVVLDRYQFEKKHYHRIRRVGFSWSITNDIQVKKDFLLHVRKLIHPMMFVTSDFFRKPIGYVN